ncbi:MAG: DUF1800 domain-containing protein [Pyrinomonadaceae bacterium]|nr:DUF1800 domain-containing protein [Pyrinomonadaceae bacterium]
MSMKAFKKNRLSILANVTRRAAALVSVLALLSSTFLTGASAQQKQAHKQRLDEDQLILHVLNRLGFGARPGDVERVRALGIENYIKQQLNPAGIADEVVEAKTRNLPVLSMTTAELYAKYPNPGLLLRQLQRQGQLPADLSETYENRKGGNAAPPNASNQMMPKEGEAGKNEDGEMRDEDRAAYRRVIRDYYIKNNLRPPQQLVQELQASRILRAVYSERQLQEVMVDFWTNHFNIFAGKGVDRWLLVSYDRDAIRPNTFGKFRDLLLATAQSPAMLFYLDNFQSVSPDAPQGANRMNRRMQQGQQRGGLNDMGGRRRQERRALGASQEMRRPDGEMIKEDMPERAQQQRVKRGINENYARELMELHTLGVDGGYTQKDVQEVARCFTGWTIFDPRGVSSRVAPQMADNAGKFYFNPRLHDDGEKTVLGQKIPAGGGIKDGLVVLEILSKHPATAKFIATKLATKFVSDTPSNALVERIAAAYTRSDGNIRETLRAIFTAPEFIAPDTYRAKIKTPFELAVSAIRTLGGETNGGPSFHQWIARMGEPIYGYQAPTGYPDTAQDWVNTGALLERLNFGLALANNRIPGTRVNLARFAADEKSAAADKAQTMERFLAIILQSEVSQKTKETLLKQVNAPLPEAVAKSEPMSAMDDDEDYTAAPQRRRREMARANFNAGETSELVKIVGLILGSPEFQRQ